MIHPADAASARSDYEACLVAPDASLHEAMRRMNDANMSIVLVVDAQRRLLGVVVDGDVRRALLRNPDMGQKVAGIMTRQPRTAPFDVDEDTLRALAEQSLSAWLPLVDREGMVRGLVDLVRLRQARRSLPNAVVIMAGGRGERLWPHTADTPKPLVTVGGRPILETVMRVLHGHGFTRFYLAVNYLAEQIEAHFGDGASLGVAIEYLREERPLGTVGGLRSLVGRERLPILVMNGDVLTRLNPNALLDFHLHEKAVATIALRDYAFEIPFGVVEAEGARFVAIREKPMHTVRISAGVYVLEPEILELVPEATRFDMPELIAAAAERYPGRVACFPVSDYWVDIGRQEDLERARVEFGRLF
jgi:dTDP-glucose pyrophosphorylase